MWEFLWNPKEIAITEVQIDVTNLKNTNNNKMFYTHGWECMLDLLIIVSNGKM